MWKPGNSPDSVVADTHEPGTNDHPTNVEYYGGYLVCETVGWGLGPTLCVAPEALEVCRLLLRSEAIAGLPKLWEAVKAATAVVTRHKELAGADAPAAADPVADAREPVRGLSGVQVIEQSP